MRGSRTSDTSVVDTLYVVTIHSFSLARGEKTTEYVDLAHAAIPPPKLHTSHARVFQFP